VAAVALLVTAAAAAAATIPIKGGEVDWGIKASFRSYIKSPIAAGKIELSGGAVEADDGTYKFPVESGTYDLTSHTTEVQSRGTVHFTGHFDPVTEEPALDMTVADPRVVLEGEAGAVFANVTSKSLTTGEAVDYPGVEMATLDTSEVAPSFEGEAVSLAGIPAELTAAGAEAFAGFYTAGAALDPLGVVAAFEPTPPPVEETEEGKKTEQPKSEDPKSGDSPQAAAPAPVPDLPLPTLKKATKGAAMLGGGGAARLATISCPTAQACTLKAPRRVKFKAGGKGWSAKVIAPHWILPGKSGKVAVKVPRAALPHLARGKARISLKLVLGVGTQSKTQVVKATLKARGH
jgi:hypothetical protein